MLDWMLVYCTKAFDKVMVVGGKKEGASLSITVRSVV